MGWFENWRRRRLLARAQLPEDRWRAAVAALPLLRGLTDAELTRLRNLSVLFLHEKHPVAAGDLQLDDDMRLYIAAQACLPILNLGLNYYSGWTSVIVYPEGFWSPHRSLDAAGVLHSGYQARVGEAWDRGPIVLSWADVQQASYGGGFNVVIHECAHKLDLLNGVANGMPPLHDGMSLPAWTQAFTAAYSELCRCLDDGAEPPIHPYAAESPGEFFAVVSEAFFEIPAVLQAAYPAVYAQLHAFYRQDPLLRLG
ncbi:MAG: M90 family metallopeptidase [Candidatus Competibacteraceae bacterium]